MPALADLFYIRMVKHIGLITNNMKRPIFIQEQRINCNIDFLKFEIAKLRFKREFEKSYFIKFVKSIVELLAKVLPN